jgi:hypothetical protein
VANYVVTGRDGEGNTLVTVSVSGVDQETQVTDDLSAVNAVRQAFANTDGVDSVVVRKYEQVITII